MLNNEAKKNAIDKLEQKQNEYKDKYDEVVNECIDLYKIRKESSLLIGVIETYINILANTPKHFKSDFEEIKLNLKEFNYAIELEQDSEKFSKVTGISVASGVATGVGVAAFAPTAAMAVATTFGTASTGAAISGLSGAAATNAALAWLGGGALAAGGGGMAAGNALLALAGPVGWAIGGASLLCGGVLLGSKNKKVAEEATKSRKAIEEEIQNLNVISKSINDLKITINLSFENIQETYFYANQNIPYDYLECSENEKYVLGELVNNVKVLSELLNERVN